MNDNRKYSWIGSFIREESSKAFYKSVKIIDKSNLSEVIYSVGDIVYFQSETSLPYIAEIESLYESKSSGKKHVNAKWYYRNKDVKDLAPSALDNIKSKRYTEVYFSDMKDENDVRSILKRITVFFYIADEDDDKIENVFSFANRNELKDTFFCRCQFDTKLLKVDKVKASVILSLQDRYHQNENPLIRGNYN